VRRADEVRLETGERLFSTDTATGEVGVVVYHGCLGGTRAGGRFGVERRPRRDRSVFEVGNRVRVRIGPVTAEVTASSSKRLELAHGGVAYATFKATGTRLVPL